MTATREFLTSDLTYYVRTDGSDSNDGLTYSSGGSFLTLQKAMDVIHDTLDLGGHVVTIDVGPGTFASGAIASGPFTGASGPGSVVFQGVGGFAGTIIDTSGACFTAQYDAQFTVGEGLKLKGGTFGLMAIHGGRIITAPGLCYDACGIHNYATRFGYIELAGDYVINAGATNHHQSSHHGNIRVQGCSATFGANCTFTAFAYSMDVSDICYTNGATINLNAQTVTGKRYLVEENAVIQWSGGNANSFPGSSAGSTATGGQYVV